MGLHSAILGVKISDIEKLVVKRFKVFYENGESIYVKSIVDVPEDSSYFKVELNDLFYIEDDDFDIDTTEFSIEDQDYYWFDFINCVKFRLKSNPLFGIRYYCCNYKFSIIQINEDENIYSESVTVDQMKEFCETVNELFGKGVLESNVIDLSFNCCS